MYIMYNLFNYLILLIMFIHVIQRKIELVYIYSNENNKLKSQRASIISSVI